ncbi:hypothetical protein EV130_101674 [Rhizobium azibense]|nr:hypothetical protein EV130_101674 [Rhizobium azibense]
MEAGSAARLNNAELARATSCQPDEMEARNVRFAIPSCYRTHDLEDHTGTNPADRGLQVMSDQEKWTGGCLCGGCRYEFHGEPPHSGYCHCNMCKRATGGPFAVLVQARLSDFVWTTGKPSVYRSSPIATRGFCANCGTPLFLQYDGDELIRLTAGSLDHPERIRPAGHYGVESRLRWAECGPGLPEEQTQERF